MSTAKKGREGPGASATGGATAPLNRGRTPSKAKFVSEATVTPMAAAAGRAFVAELKRKPGDWAQVPKGIAVRTMRMAAHFSQWFGHKVETRVVEGVQYARWVDVEGA